MITEVFLAISSTNLGKNHPRFDTGHEYESAHYKRVDLPATRLLLKPLHYSTLNKKNENAPCAKQVISVSLLESRLSELGRIPVSVLGDGNCFFSAVSRQLNSIPRYHFYIRSLGVQHLLHHPGLHFESNVL